MSWKTLRLDLPNDVRLLGKWSFDSAGYEIQLSDLSRVWAEKASKNDILRRATGSGSSIDPSQDDEQLGIFLGKIKSALNEEEGTSLTITNADQQDKSALRLDMCAPLPKPLKPFRWSMNLARQPTHHLETEIVTPLISQATNLKHKMQRLIDELHDKDRVIAKICDRLETSGNDLTTVFPGVSNVKTSRKKGQREQLAKYVKGLEDFDEAAWRERLSLAHDDDELDGHGIDAIFRDLPNRSSTGETVDAKDGEWWKALGKGSRMKPASQVSDASHSQTIRGSEQDEAGSEGQHDEMEDVQQDGFQRQHTPPHIGHEQAENTTRHTSDADQRAQASAETSRNTVPDGQGVESSTDDEDDLDAGPRHTQTHQKELASKDAAVPITPRKLGVMGGRAVRKTPSPAADSPTAKSSKSRSTLGTIGGRARAESPLPQEDSTSQHLSPPARSSKMGVIGGKAATKPSSQFAASQQRSNLQVGPAKQPSPERSQDPPKATNPAPEEPLEVVADRKRDALERELDDKAKAPVKKKRKF